MRRDIDVTADGGLQDWSSGRCPRAFPSRVAEEARRAVEAKFGAPGSPRAASRSRRTSGASCADERSAARRPRYGTGCSWPRSSRSCERRDTARSRSTPNSNASTATWSTERSSRAIDPLRAPERAAGTVWRDAAGRDRSASGRSWRAVPRRWRSRRPTDAGIRGDPSRRRTPRPRRAPSCRRQGRADEHGDRLGARREALREQCGGAVAERTARAQVAQDLVADRGRVGHGDRGDR